MKILKVAACLLAMFFAAALRADDKARFDLAGPTAHTLAATDIVRLINFSDGTTNTFEPRHGNNTFIRICPRP